MRFVMSIFCQSICIGGTECKNRKYLTSTGTCENGCPMGTYPHGTGALQRFPGYKLLLSPPFQPCKSTLRRRLGTYVHALWTKLCCLHHWSLSYTMLEGGGYYTFPPTTSFLILHGRIAVTGFRCLPDSFVADRFQMLHILKDVNFQQFWSPSPGACLMPICSCNSGDTCDKCTNSSLSCSDLWM